MQSRVPAGTFRCQPQAFYQDLLRIKRQPSRSQTPTHPTPLPEPRCLICFSQVVVIYVNIHVRRRPAVPTARQEVLPARVTSLVAETVHYEYLADTTSVWAFPTRVNVNDGQWECGESECQLVVCWSMPGIPNPSRTHKRVAERTLSGEVRFDS